MGELNNLYKYYNECKKRDVHVAARKMQGVSLYGKLRFLSMIFSRYSERTSLIDLTGPTGYQRDSELSCIPEVKMEKRRFVTTRNPTPAFVFITLVSLNYQLSFYRLEHMLIF